MLVVRGLEALAIAVYGSGAIVVTHFYWRSVSRRDVDKALENAQAVSPPLKAAFAAAIAPILTVVLRPLWGLFHGLLWPLLLWKNRAPRRHRRG